MEGCVASLQRNRDFLFEHIFGQYIGQMLPVNETEVMAAGAEADAAVLHSRIVEQNLASNLEVRGEKGPEDGILW